MSYGCELTALLFMFRQGNTAGTSSGIAQRARHPDELQRDNSTWMIDIDYYLSQQVVLNKRFFLFSFQILLSKFESFSFGLSNNVHSLKH